MKIGFCVDLMDSGGAERVASILCNGFANSGCETDLIMISESKKESFYPLDEKVNLIPLLEGKKSNNISFLKKVRLLKKRFALYSYDVVISFLPNVNICVWLASRQNKAIKHIVSERNNPYIDPKNKFKRFIKNISFRYSDGIVCQTNDSKSYFSERMDLPIRIIKNPIDSFSEAHQFEQTNNEIISVGRLEPQKNFELLIDAFNIFSKEHPESKLKIYGDGSLKKKIQERIDLYELSDLIILLGNSKTWIDDSINSAMYISSSLYEGMPNALLEAVSNGIPSIASDCPIGGSREIISNNENGLLFENNNLHDLVQKMNQLYLNRDLVNKFRNNSIKVKKQYSTETIVREWLTFINEIVEGNIE